MWEKARAVLLLLVVCYACLQKTWARNNISSRPQPPSRHLLETTESPALESPTASEAANQSPLMGPYKDVTHLGVERRAHVLRQQHLALFVGVLSTSSNTEARRAIRETWGGDHRLHRVMFFLAMPKESEALDALQTEAARYRDMEVEPHTREAYFNVTHQTLDIFRAAIVDKAVTHILKVDDDTYLRVTPILGLITQLPQEHFMLGNIGRNPGGPERENPAVAWYLTRKEWPRDTYPMWADGGSGFVLSMDFAAGEALKALTKRKGMAVGLGRAGGRIPFPDIAINLDCLLQDLVHEIAAGAAMQAVGGLMKMEDVAVGVWVEQVARKTGWLVTYIHHDGFNRNWCDPGDITSHKVTPERTRCIFEHLDQATCCLDENNPK